MGWSWLNRKNGTNKKQTQSKTRSKKQSRKRKTFILEEIITPSIAVPIGDLDAKVCPADGGAIHLPPTHDLPPLFLPEELGIDFLIPNNPVGNFDPIVPPNLNDTGLTGDLISLDSNTNIEDFLNIQDLLAQINNGDLSGLINPILPIELTDQLNIIGAIETLPPPVILPIDPPGSQLNLPSNYNPINDFPSVTQPKNNNNAGETSNLNLSPETLSNLNQDLTQIRELINQNNSSSLFDALSSEETEAALERITDIFANNSDLVELLAKPDELANLGIDTANIQVIKDFLNNPEVAESMGLPVSLGEALSNPDSTILDKFLLNAAQAHYLLPINAQQPVVGIIDFTQNQHSKQVNEIFNSINPLIAPKNYTVKNNDWATELVKYVNTLKSQGETRGIVNLSFDLSQLDEVGVTTRYELTTQELAALQYARDHNVLVVVASGNTGGTMSALGKASKLFDNIITVGAVNQFEVKTDYSGYGNGLTVVAPGGSWQDDPNAFVGTSRATSYVTAAASLVWAANPDLSWQQVKDLLIETARDLNTPGWDAETGSGLIDIQEAISRAQLTRPQAAPEAVQVTAPEFSGINRVQVLARPASENTEDAIANLIQNQEDLWLQWQTLIDLGNPDLDLEDLKTTVKDRINQAFEQYQQVTTDQAITKVELEQIQDALNLAISHYQIERERLNKLQAQKQQLEANLVTLGKQKTALEAENKQLLESIQQKIINVESDLEKAKAKLINLFADTDKKLRLNSELIYEAATAQKTASNNFLKTSQVQTAEAQRFTKLANSINPVRWQVLGYKSQSCNRSQPVFGWAVDPNLAKQKQQYQWQAGIANQNANALNTLSNAAATEADLLNKYGKFIDTQKDQVTDLVGNLDDANKLIEFLKAQIKHQEAVFNQYFQLAKEAEKRRAQNQANADWHRSLINRWEVVGTKSKKSGKREDVWGWRHYPEHIAPYQQAQNQANLAAQESKTYSHLAQQADAEQKLLQEQLRKLQERLGDWPSLKQGIEYEIAAHELHLQAEKDLLAMHTPVQEQKLETLNLSIQQVQTDLDKLVLEKLPAQQKLTDSTEQRWQETQAEAAIKLNAYDKAQNNLQDFLEFSGFLLPYRERLSALEKQIEHIEAEKFNIEFSIVELNQVLIQSPSETGVKQLKNWANYLEKLEQHLTWANIQKDQLALAIADSPERLEIAALIKKLEQPNAPEFLKNKIDNLKVLEGSGANFLQGFNDLPERLAATQTDLEGTKANLIKLNDDYVKLGLAKADLEDQQIPAKEQAIATKEQEILKTQEAITLTSETLPSKQNELGILEQNRQDLLETIADQENTVATTQSQSTALQEQIVSKNSQIQQQQTLINNYQAQINNANARVSSLDQQRQQHQNAANYWSGQVYVFNEAAYLTGYPDVAKAVAERWWGPLSSGWYHYLIYGQYEGRFPNPIAKTNQTNQQKLANLYAQQRDVAQIQAQQLSTTLQPEITNSKQQIIDLTEQENTLIQQKQEIDAILNDENQELQQLKLQLNGITQDINSKQAEINQIQGVLDQLNTTLPILIQERDILVNELETLNQEKADLEQALTKKYEEIGLTEQYLAVMKDEKNRLQSRLNLLNQAGIIDQQYTENWQQWQQSYQAQQDLINQLLTTRTASQPDRDLLASLETQLETANQQLQKAQTLEQTIAETNKDIQFTNLQIGNQKLLLQTLTDREPSLVAAEQYYYSLAEQHRKQIWFWNGREWAYNAGEAAAYRGYLQQASFIADELNKLSQQVGQTEKKIQALQDKLTAQNTQVQDAKQELINLVSVTNIQAKIESLKAQITTVKGRLKPFEEQERQQSQSLTTAINDNQKWLDELMQTSALQNTALEQLISFGVLTSESDVDFFATEVEPQVQGFLKKLKERLESLETQIIQNEALQNSYVEKLQATVDPVLQEAQIHLILQTQVAAAQLQDLKQKTQQNIETLTSLLGKANDALLPIRQKQELEIREKINTNDTRLQSLNSLLATENLAKQAIQNNTVLDYVQLQDQVQQDLIFGVQNWTKLLLDSYQQTKDLGNRHQDLSASVDELIADITGNLADPQGEYERIKLVLGEGIKTLGVLENRADQFDLTVDSVEDAIEQIKLRIQQDTELWEEIAPIAIRYGVESKALEDYQHQSKLFEEAQKIIEPFFQLEKQKEERLKLSDNYRYFENPNNGNRYFLTNAVTTWHGAQTEAQRVGGNLVTIRNQDEQQWLASHFKTSAWMGLNDVVREGQWTWVSGEPVTYTNFLPGQPDNAGGLEDWTEFVGQSSGKWNDVQYWNGAFQNSKPGLVEVSVKDLEKKQEPIIQQLVKWAEDNNAFNTILDLAHQLVEQLPDKEKYSEELKALGDHLSEFDRLTEQGKKDLATKHLIYIIDNAQTLLKPLFVESNLNNGSAIGFLKEVTLQGTNSEQQVSQQLNTNSADVLLKAVALEGRTPNQLLFDKAKAAKANHEAQGHALLAQAAWYQRQAAAHWNLSRKNGPTWTEWRRVCKRKWYGKKKCWDEKIVHVDHHWILWQQYSQIFPQLRKQGYNHLAEAAKWQKGIERIEPLKDQWVAANDAANNAEPSIIEARNLFEQLEAAHESVSADKIQLETLENLLPTIQEQLQQAVQEANAQNAKVNEQWEDYDVNSEEYINAVTEILKERGELNQKSIAMQQEIADAEKWVERQSVALATELENTKTLLTELQNQQQTLTEQLSQASAEKANEIKTKLAQLEPAVKQLNNKATILTAQQTTLTQKRTLLTAQNEVILAEQRLLDAYLKDPDADHSNLQQQLQDTRTALAEAQRLAEQAEAASQALTAPVQELKQDLLAQNDEHLKQAKAASLLLKDLVEATQANQNYALQVAQKQQQVNDLEFQILQRLQTATAAGYQEAKHLLNVAQYNDMATAAEIYYRDYSDLASDRGGGCSGGGVATANDRVLADNYYREMLNYRQLQNQAQAQANAFRHARETAQAQMRTLEIQQQNASEALQTLQEKLNTASENRATLEQEYVIAQTRLQGITRIREQTEQTFNQLVTLEQLNLAQAQLEQEIAKQRQTAIDQAVQERYERDYLELQRKRQETTARLEQLRQLQAEDQFRDSLNQARAQLGLETLDSPNNSLDIATQMATLLGGLQQLQQQNPEFPDDLKALLNEANADIHAALQGKEAQTIQQNLLNTMSGLIEQIQVYKTEINNIELQDQLDYQLLETSQSNLQSASQQLLDELKRSGNLQGENEVINPLYLEALNKVALAEQAVDISNDLAQQSKESLEQIIKQRIEERKARKKAFWNKILGIVSTVFSLLGAVLTFIPGANLIGLALGAVGGAISTVQAAINGDWMGAIFSAVMAGANFVGGAIGGALKAGKAVVMGMAKTVAEKVLTTIKTFQSLASGAFNGVRNLLSGDNIMGFLQIIGGLAGAATSGLQNAILNSPLGEFGYKVVESLSKAPTLIYGGIKAIQSGDWVSGIGNIIKGIVSLAKTWTNDFNEGNESPGEKIANILENISSVGIGVSKFITGGLEGLLEGLGDILDGLGDDIQKWVDKLFPGGDCECSSPEEELASAAEVIVDEIIDLSPDEMAQRLEGLDPELRLEVMDWLSSTLSTEEQITVVSKLPLEQQAEVIPNLPQETLEKWRDIFLAEVGKKAIEIESQSNISTSLQLTTVINGELQTIGALSGSNAPTHKEIFGQIVSKSLDGLPSEIGKAFMQMITDPEQLSTLLVSSAKGYVYGGYLAALHLNPATVGFAVGADVVLTGILITQVLKPFYRAWQESSQIVSDAQLTGQIDQNAVDQAIQELRSQNANFLAQNIPSLATGIVGGLSRLSKPQSKPQLNSQIPIPEHPDLPGGLTNPGYGASIRYTPNMLGPLPLQVRNSFRSGTYTAKNLEQPLTLYRVIPEGKNLTGSYWTRVKPQGTQQVIMDLSLLSEWYINPQTKVIDPLTKVIKIEVPTGTRIYEGLVAPQTSRVAPHSLPGGGNQVYIPEVNPSWVKESWSVKSSP